MKGAFNVTTFALAIALVVMVIFVVGHFTSNTLFIGTSTAQEIEIKSLCTEWISLSCDFDEGYNIVKDVGGTPTSLADLCSQKYNSPWLVDSPAYLECKNECISCSR